MNKVCDNNGNIDTQTIMPQKFNEQEFSEQLDAIKTAAKHGQLEILRDLHIHLMAEHNGWIKNPNARELLQTQPIAEAVNHNHLDCVRFLMPWSDLQSPWNRSLPRAAESGHQECLKLLLPHSSEELIYEALVSAAYNQQWECVTIILDCLDAPFDVQFQGNLETTLLWASQYQQHNLLQRLYPLCNIDRALKYARGRWDDNQLLALTDYHNSVQQHKILSSVVEHTHSLRRSKM